MRNFGYIYLTTNLKNGKLYIGQTKGNFSTKYFGSGKLIRQALKKHGNKNFTVKLLHLASSRKKLNHLEISEISKYRKKYGVDSLYNLSSGGYQKNSGYFHSEESKRKNSEAHKGKITWMKGKHHTNEAKKKLREANLGKHPTEETKNKQRLASSGRFHSEDTKIRMRINSYRKGKPAWNKGILTSELGYCSGMKGKRCSEETKRKMSKIRKLYWYRRHQLEGK